MNNCWKRRDVVIGLAGAVPALAPFLARAATKYPVCHACEGDGQCASGACVNDECAPNDSPCGVRTRQNYECRVKKDTGILSPACCFDHRHRGKTRCVFL